MKKLSTCLLIVAACVAFAPPAYGAAPAPATEISATP
ncbi:MAG: hypothetical protein JWP66_1737 [Naasia sp.]|nr:hypothetical protein [Naasia sp.]